MKKLIIMAAAAATGLGAALAAEDGQGTARNWRLTVGGFGRGDTKASVLGMGSDRVEAYGADLDVQYSVWQNERFGLWAGIGGTFCPRQKASDSFGSSRTQASHDVSTDGSTVVDFDYREANRGSLDLGYGELRLLLVPEWKATDALSFGLRLGAALDWLNAKYTGRQDWAWGQRTAIDIPPYVHDVIDEADAGSDGATESETRFAAQGIVGVQATYLFTESLGLYANFDWRLGGATRFDVGEGRDLSVDMSGWCWAAGAVVSF